MSRKHYVAVVNAVMILGLILALWGGDILLKSESSVATAPPASVLTVEVVTPRYEDWPYEIEASGSVVPWQEIVVSPETGGLAVTALLVEVGDRVRRGQELARLSDSNLQIEQRQQDAVVAEAKANLELATVNFNRAKALDGSGSLSDQSIDEYRVKADTALASFNYARAVLDSIHLKITQTRIVATDDGIVSSKSGVVGSVVSSGAELYRMIRQGRTEWRPELNSHEISEVRPGARTRLSLSDSRVLEGRVLLVEPTLSTNTGRGVVHVTLPLGSEAYVGAFLKGTLEIGTQRALVIPQSAIVQRDGRAYVYVVDAQSKVNSLVVSTRRRNHDSVEVSGVALNSRIVKNGAAFLSEGAQVTVIAYSANPAKTRAAL